MAYFKTMLRLGASGRAVKLSDSFCPVGYVFLYSLTSGHMSIQTLFSSGYITPFPGWWNRPWYPAI